MRILQIASGADLNGAAVHCRHLCELLAARGHEVTLLCRANSWIADNVSRPLVAVEYSTMKRRFGELARVARFIRAGRFDVMHTHQTSAQLLGVIQRRLCGCPVVATAHAMRIHVHWRFNDRVIAVSDAARDFHRRFSLVPARRISTIHNFVDCGAFDRVDERSRSRVRDELGIAQDAVVVGVVGRIDANKNQASLPAMIARLAENVPELMLLVVGSGNPREVDRLQDLARQRRVGRRLVMTGDRDDVPQLLAAVDVVAQPSRMESFGLSLVEAMAARRPVVAYEVGGVREVATDGETGFLVRAGDEAAFEHRLGQLLQNSKLRQQFAEAGRQLARQRFSFESQAPRIEAELARAAFGARTRSAA